MTCAQCDTLTRQLRETREEFAAWREREAETRGASVAVDRLQRAQRAFGGARPGEMRLLLALLDCSPKALTREILLRRTTTKDPDSLCGTKSVEVHLCRLRALLRGCGFDAPISTVRGGYLIEASAAARLKLAIGDVT